MNRTIAFAASLCLAATATAQYTLTDLGSLAGGATYGYKINASGMAVGFSMTPQGARGFAWSRTGGMQNLGVLRNDPSSFALGLTDSGRVVGYSGSGAMRTAFSWTQSGGMVDLGTFGSDAISLGLGANDAGQSVGLSGFDSGTKRAFLHTGSGMTDLGFVPGRNSSYARDVNGLGSVVGHSVGSDSLAFLWRPSVGMTVLPHLLGGTTSAAQAINENGAIAGWATDALGKKRAVVWQTGSGGGPITVDGGSGSGSGAVLEGAEALDVNNLGQVVGYGLLENQERAFFYDPVLGARRLDQVIGQSAAGWTFVRAQGINDSGEIVGYGLFNGQTHAFVASPVPEPATGLVILAGTLALARRRRR
jgi:probable HAF family extracellular repeat protein